MKKLLKNSALKLVSIFILSFGLNLYGHADIIRLVVKEDRASCTGVAPQTCYQVKYNNSKNWELFYDQIAGFKYKPGYRYVLQVQRTKRINVPADASAYQYKLKKVLKKYKVQTKPVKEDGVWGFVSKHKWNLIQLNGVTQENSPAFLIFDTDKARFNGYAGCNNFFGGFEKTATTITFKQIGSTLMACADERKNKLEADLLNLMSDKTFRYDVADQTLNLYQDNKLVLMFGMSSLN